VIKVFQDILLKQFNIDPCTCVTLSSLAIKILKTNFFPDKIKIPTLSGLPFVDIMNAYTGGAVDIYKPYGENVTRIDANSLYPSVILNYFPVGVPVQFIGDYKLVSAFKNKLAIVEAKIITPQDLNKPLLIVKEDDGTNIRPLGE
jgi:DNA polymerase type B, organellar and viral